MRTIVVGDIHGCYDEFRDLLDAVKYDTEKDHLILLGDLVDRGPHSDLVVVYAQTLKNVTIIMGNHDEKHVRYRDGVRAGRKELPHLNDGQIRVHKKLTDDDIDFMSTFQPYYKISDKYVAVHGGLRPGVPLEEQKVKEMVRLRYIDEKTGKTAKFGPDYSQPEGTYYWAEKWTGPYTVFFGHHIHSKKPKIIGSMAMALDTGACFGGYLSASILESPDSSEYSTVSVKARDTYMVPGKAVED